MKCFLPPSSKNPKNIQYSVPHGPWRVHHGPWYLPRFFVLVEEVAIDTSLACRPRRREQQLLWASCLAPSRGYLMSNNCSTLPETKRVPQPLNGLRGKGLRFLVFSGLLKDWLLWALQGLLQPVLGGKETWRPSRRGKTHGFSMEIPSRLPWKWFPQNDEKNYSTGNYINW